METIHVRTVVPKSHRVEINLPPEIPVGPADMVIVVESALPIQEGTHQATLLHLLKGLDQFRKRFDGRNVNLSEAVIQERREGDANGSVS